MKNLFAICCITCAALSANMPNLRSSKQETYEVVFHNKPLAKVHGKVFSVMDVKKKMDLILHEHQPETLTSNLLLYQFYAQNWRTILQDMIDNELMKMEAEDLKININDGDIHEEMNKRFGPSIATKIDLLGLSYDEAKELVREDIIVRNMAWFRIWSKVVQNVTPEMIKSEYEVQLAKLPANDQWIYKVASLRGDNEAGMIAQKAYELLKYAGETSLDQSNVLQINENLPSPAFLNISDPITISSKDLSPEVLKVLESTPSQTFSSPTPQKSRSDGATVYRMFYVMDHKEDPPPSFEALSLNIRNILMEKLGSSQKEEYLTKLRKRYCYETLVVKNMFPANYQPFMICNGS